MLSLDFSRLSKVAAEHGVTEKDKEPYESKLSEYLNGIKGRDQGFYEVIFDKSMVEDIHAFSNSVQGTYSDIVILGIGGSALGMQTIRDSLTHLFASGETQLHILDNIDPVLLRECVEAIDLEETLFIVISKSGGTPETLAQYALFRQLVEEDDLDPRDHFVFVTDPDKGFLREIANEEGIESFIVPPNVGGRFSALTDVGLLPASLIGVDIEALLDGACDMAELFLSEDPEANVPFRLAMIQHILGQKGKTNVVMMPYVQKLKTFSDWYAQLLAESTGKIDAHGNNVGLSPVSALGVTDQHSQLQLYTQGPSDKQFILIKSNDTGEVIEIPDLGDHEKVQMLKGVNFEQLLYTEMEATADTLTEEHRPTMTIEIDRVDPYHLGALMMLFEGATAFLGEMMEIDAFDQPGVERSKVLTREYLKES